MMSRIYDEVDSGYAEACSDVTVCSNKKGFFKSLANEVVSIAESSGFLNTFDEIDERSKVKAVMENETIMTTLQTVFSRIEPIYRGKDARVSYERRIAAQAALKDNELPKALALASQAVLRATMTGVDEVIDGGVTLALALWVRSEVLLKMEKPNAALEDLKLALKERLPAKMRAQYYWRMGHCYKGAQERTRAKVSYELAGRLLGNNEEAKIQLQKDIESLEHISNESITKSSGITLTGGAKINIPALSKLVKITEEENKGRFVVANDQIKTGDVLLVDSPYAACLISDYYGSHCLHCFKRLEICDNGAPIWCSICSGVAFCSVECRDIAVTTYHPHECKFIDLFIGSGMSILSHIALRMITQAGLQTSLQIYSSYVNSGIKSVEGTIVNDIEGSAKKSRIKSRKERLHRLRKYHNNFADQNVNCETKSVEDKGSYQDKLEMTAAQIYSLCTHSISRKGRDYLKRVVMAMFLTECLKRGGFFNKLDMETEIKAETSICELIIHNLQLLQFNAHEIYETVRGQHQFSGSKPVYIAVGIYPTGALFNHECYPAVTRYFEGKKIVLRAIRPLSPGATVSENYGPHFLVRSYKERRRALACRYWFQCECVACREDWPTLKQMQSLTPYLRCPNTDCSSKFQANPKSMPKKCSKCSTVIDPKLIKLCMENIDECQTLYQEGAKLMDQENLDAVSSLCKGVNLFHEVATPPHRDTHLAQESLRVCFAASGNIYKLPEASI
ncbi:unnamed protein product [Pieris brassicae]|uniref:SET domain-containing protein n=1 Tax=Pieris brassicae TaxID=7116 RepID=A0A9P0TZA0_PIEBR|nr:unnamed protein product [Pieris brassicae]